MTDMFRTIDDALEFAKDMKEGTGFMVKIDGELILITQTGQGVRWHIVGEPEAQ